MNKRERFLQRLKKGKKRTSHIYQFNPNTKNKNKINCCKDVRKVINELGTTGKPCSCWICQNERRSANGINKLTLQERKAREDAELQIKNNNIDPNIVNI